MKTLVILSAFLLALSSCSKTMPKPCPGGCDSSDDEVYTPDPDPDPDPYTDPNDPSNPSDPDDPDDPGYGDPGSDDGSCSTNRAPIHAGTTVHWNQVVAVKPGK